MTQPTPTPPPTQGAGPLLALLQEQRSVYLNLGALSQRQSDLIASGDTNGLLELLVQRQQVIERLAEINVRFEPYKRSWADFWEPLDGPTRARLQGLIREVQTLVDQIMAQDDKDYAALAQCRDQVAQDAKRLNRGSAVNRAYGSTPSAEARYADHQG